MHRSVPYQSCRLLTLSPMSGRAFILDLLLLAFVLMPIVLAIPYVASLDRIVQSHFEGKRWALPGRVYARPLEIYRGLGIGPEQFAAELRALKYYRSDPPGRPGTFFRKGNEFRIITRPFRFWDGEELSGDFTVVFDKGGVSRLGNAETRKPLSLVRLEPRLIGSIYPAQHEDRILVQLKDVPALFIQALLAIEDQDFYQHYGVDPAAIGRALLVNVRARDWVQGGSTLTQQLVKNFFLSSERTLWRKLNEAIMALLLEWHYDKDEILETYLNEIYLGQEGRRAIHGVGLASWFYFDRSVGELRPHETALLVALVRGPSLYDPRRHPDRALARRNLVIDILEKQGIMNADEARKAKAAPLAVTAKTPEGDSPYPAFLDLVRRQLQRDYREEDLTSEGLRIFTTLDPLVQDGAEQALAHRILRLEKEKRLKPGTLEGAAIIASIEGGEVLAVIGGRDSRFAGFNRALDALRPIGSLVKPAVYLAALEQPSRYTLATLLDDGPITFRTAGAKPWSPKNYDQRHHGYVPLHRALANSYNLSTVRLGLEVGVPEVVKTLQRLGLERQISPYPSVLLGSPALSPLEVAQIYETLASGGFRTPLRAIREVLDLHGKPLQRYALTVEQAFAPEPIYLVNSALQEVVRNGTGRSLARILPPELTVAGKTGTTDELRDSWFAGFSGNHLVVVWLGRDDNQSIDLSGAVGAMPIWGDIIRAVGSQPLQLAEPPDIEFVPIDPATGLRADIGCERSEPLPFVLGSAPREVAPCGDTWATVDTREPIDSTATNYEEETVPVQPSADWQGEVQVDEPPGERVERAVRRTVDWLRDFVR